MKNILQNFFKSLYRQIFFINDSPQKIALGFGLGVFLGIIPGTGPLAAVTLAIILKINKAAALIGSLLLNTWINIITFVFALKLGSKILGINWRDIYDQSLEIIQNFHFKALFNQAILKILLPTLLGYFIISLILGVISYFTILIIIKFNKKTNATDHAS